MKLLWWHRRHRTADRGHDGAAEAPPARCA